MRVGGIRVQGLGFGTRRVDVRRVRESTVHDGPNLRTAWSEPVFRVSVDLGGGGGGGELT